MSAGARDSQVHASLHTAHTAAVPAALLMVTYLALQLKRGQLQQLVGVV